MHVWGLYLQRFGRGFKWNVYILTRVRRISVSHLSVDCRIWYSSVIIRVRDYTSLVVNICVLPLSGSWSYRAIDWTVSVVGAFLWRAHRLGICCQTVFVTQNWVLILSNVSWRHTFLQNIDGQNVLSAIEIFLSMRYINLHFTYLLTYLHRHAAL